jgi:hypothetical protein
MVSFLRDEEEMGEVPREISSSLIPKYASPTPMSVIDDEGLISK